MYKDPEERVVVPSGKFWRQRKADVGGLFSVNFLL
jgi:hypothetical protein